MKVLPKLNMNKHPEEATNGSLIDAVNMMVSKDNFMLQTEPTPTINKITDKLKKLITTDNYNIFHIIPCNRELIIFVNEGEDAKSSLYRYNETEDNIKLYIADGEHFIKIINVAEADDEINANNFGNV